MLSTRWELQNPAVKVHAVMARKASGRCPWQDGFARNNDSQLTECCGAQTDAVLACHMFLSPLVDVAMRCRTVRKNFCSLASIVHKRVLASQQEEQG